MTTIRATCPTCGEVGLTPDEIELRVDDRDNSASFYAFACPSCFDTVRKPADERVVRLLISGGVEVLESVPAGPEPRRLVERVDGPAISHDDILDFHDLLDSGDWFSELNHLVRRDDATA